MSGLCASLAALERGARVVTVEKGTRFGGSMALSGGAMWTYVDKDLLREHIPDGNRLLQNIVVDTLSEGHDWLERHGVAMSPERDIEQTGTWALRGSLRDDDNPGRARTSIGRTIALEYSAG